MPGLSYFMTFSEVIVLSKRSSYAKNTKQNVIHHLHYLQYIEAISLIKDVNYISIEITALFCIKTVGDLNVV